MNVCNMRIAPIADVKARLSAYLHECGTEGPIVITRNGKAVAVLTWRLRTTTIWNASCWRVLGVFKPC